MRILVADDHIVFRSVLSAMLTSWGYEVVLASDGAEAWRILEGEDAPSLAILDWMMPRMDGIEICRRVRARENGRYVYILILTAKTDCEDLQKAMEAGADDYATKPFKSQELRARLRAACRILLLEEQLAAAIGTEGFASRIVERTRATNGDGERIRRVTDAGPVPTGRGLRLVHKDEASPTV